MWAPFSALMQARFLSPSVQSLNAEWSALDKLLALWKTVSVSEACNMDLNATFYTVLTGAIHSAK